MILLVWLQEIVSQNPNTTQVMIETSLALAHKPKVKIDSQPTIHNVSQTMNSTAVNPINRRPQVVATPIAT